MSYVFSRRGRLVLGELSVPLDDVDGGWICTELDLGTPEVREVTNNNPIAHGVIDRTQFLGARVVTVRITAAPGGRIALDDIVRQFGPFMDPGVRPELHYQMMSTDETEHVLTLRADAFRGPMNVPNRRDFELAWVAPDPVAMDAEVKVATAWSGASSFGGRTYPLTFDREYPVGEGGPVTGLVVTRGDLPVQPYLRIYGPVTGAVVNFTTQRPPSTRFVVAMVPTNRIDAGDFVGIDTMGHVAYVNDDLTRPVVSSLDWTRTSWPVLPPTPDSTVVTMTGESTTGLSQVQVNWQDRFLT